MNWQKTLLRVGGQRNEFGTRILRKITCSLCGADDHVSVRPKKGMNILCRACAQKELNAFEVGVFVENEKIEKNCSVCGECVVVSNRFSEDEPRCDSCKRGLFVWRGSIFDAPEDRELSTIKARPSGVALRSRNHRPSNS